MPSSALSAAHDPTPERQPTGTPQPHQLANELTGDRDVQQDTATPQTARDSQARRVEAGVARLVAPIVLGAVVIGLLVAAALWRQWTLALVAAVFVIPFLLLVSAPVWLAGATKVAQDETVREQNETASPRDAARR